MANKKITELPDATIPLDNADLFEVVQGGVNKKVAKSNVSSGAGGGHTIEDEGSPLTQRTKLNFVGTGVTVTDDSGDDATVVTIPGGGSGTGDVVGPGSATDNAIALFDTTTGKLIKDSTVVISTDGTASSNSDAKVMTEKAVVTYVAANAGGLTSDETDMLELAYLRGIYYLVNR